MSVNQRVELNLPDREDFLQDAPSKAGRTNFTPGTTNGKALDMNWPTEMPIKTGHAYADSQTLKHNRVILLGRNAICDNYYEGVGSGHIPPITDIFKAEKTTGYEGVKE